MEVNINGIKALEKLDDNLKKVSKNTMSKVGQVVETDILLGFKNETDPSGKKWAGLKPSTIKSRLRKGVGEIKILQDTGNLKKSLNRKASEGSVTIGFGAKYSVFHQLGTGDMEARKILPTEPEEIDMEEIERIILGDIKDV